MNELSRAGQKEIIDALFDGIIYYYSVNSDRLKLQCMQVLHHAIL